jgi:hypothetical protein
MPTCRACAVRDMATRHLLRVFDAGAKMHDVWTLDTAPLVKTRQARAREVYKLVQER